MFSWQDQKEFAYALKHHKDGVVFTGNVKVEHRREGRILYDAWCEKPNIFTTEGMAFLLNVIFHDISKAASNIWFVGIFKNNVTPAAGNTAAVCLGAAGTYGECQDADYDSPATNKPAYTAVDTATAVITNAAAKAEFTIAGSITVYGAFLSTATAKTATTGTLMCGKKFDSSRAVVDNDVLAVTYQITASSS
jgi:hypothetical protein